MTRTVDNAYYLLIKTYTSSGTLQNSVTILNPYRSISNRQDRSINVNVSYDWLTSLVTGDLASGTAPFINTSTYCSIRV